MLPKHKSADFIIAGAGCAGLSLAMHMINSGQFRNKKILLIDKDPKASNDRTWCFWEKEEGMFEPVVHRRWQQVQIHGQQSPLSMQIHPYQYKMIRGIDFYNYCLNAIRNEPNIEFVTGHIDEVFSKEETGVIVGGEKIVGDYVFNSIPARPQKSQKKVYRLKQHFKGWFIETESPVFDEAVAGLMDFRVAQQDDTRFGYVLPLARDKALVEYTVFSSRLLQSHEYDDALRNYITNVLKIDSYKITEQEWGVIPMTNERLVKNENRIVNMGTAGGQTKPSSGYTFRFIQKDAKAITDSLIKHGHPFVAGDSRRFHFYDSVLLRVLMDGNLAGHELFYTMFKNNDVQEVFRFLDNESSPAEELKIIASLPTMPFLKAALRHIL